MPFLDDDALGRALADRLQRGDVTATSFDPYALWQDGRRRQRRARFLLAGSGTGVCALTIGALGAGLILSNGSSSGGLPLAEPATSSPSLSAASGLPCSNRPNASSPTGTVSGLDMCTASPVPPSPGTGQLSSQALAPQFGPFSLTSLPAGYTLTARRDPIPQFDNSPLPTGLPTTSVLSLAKPGGPTLSVQCSVGATFELFTTPLTKSESRIEVEGRSGLFMDSGPGEYTLQWTPTPTRLLLVSISGATSRAAAAMALLDLAERISSS